MYLSVIIPTCNRNNLLRQCLDLLQKKAQTIAEIDYEVIVTDDSKDDCAKDLVHEKYPWALWLKGPKKGPESNRNNGATHATGEWLIFLDDDCLPKPNLLETYHLLISSNPEIKVLEGGIERERGMRSPIERAPGNSKTKGGFLLSCNFAIEKKLFLELGGFDENFKYPHMEDYDLHQRILSANSKVLFAVEATVVHPYRKIRSGWKLGKFEEMSVYYNFKHNQPSSLAPMLKAIAATHLYIIKHFIKRLRFSYDLLIAIKIMFEHLTVVVFNFHRWNRKYAKSLGKMRPVVSSVM
jgi:GT2 family glycosyltransferase